MDKWKFHIKKKTLYFTGYPMRKELKRVFVFTVLFLIGKAIESQVTGTKHNRLPNDSEVEGSDLMDIASKKVDQQGSYV